ncbi:MsnO8 family LLM class oxidoreductase [Corynebacterium sp. 320]|uniref:MsnO8 family LLM class oxidoreductase n=1 Tax=Corynebacterium TaxID=1716 RepID=UPI00125CB5B2|nr:MULTISPECIES: MsnO8 family LLM class oxidoreductase [Corynebacterium]KAB1504378.1 MsnO8 family LLM class oxidoreductase [Corynebacterium sp. 320]KAB1552523.1 MsnO8 family LLM class oxidoreductase [Corynebacterium sp. 321]KAB1554263.1 MsnO8 family LLM class oxidoreductase [Corynebacterium sp. 319]KAB3528514.1 MsnO8 family LLM class oxidoreductase [Corynebacterium sp. 250]KAB3539993.1 MsnO8 family LLM class oxidoreductase [Corynebacterium sp. 366]
MRFSLLDRAITTVDFSSDAAVLHAVTTHAKSAESMGFHRFFVAEHHAVPGIAGSQPAILANHILNHTSTIRVGTGGIMVPTYPPLVVAEQAATLQALHRGRVDVGLGSSVGFTQPVREALRQEDAVAVKKRFGEDLAEVVRYLRGEAPITQRPRLAAEAASAPPVFVLAGYRSALEAAHLGLGVILGGPIDTQVAAAEAYVDNFREGALGSPHIIPSLHVAVGEEEAWASDLLLPEAYSQAVSQTTGRFEPLQPARNLDLDALSEQQRQRVRQMQAQHLTGTPERVHEALHGIADRIGGSDYTIDEFLITGDIPDREGREESERLLMEIARGW